MRLAFVNVFRENFKETVRAELNQYVLFFVRSMLIFTQNPLKGLKRGKVVMESYDQTNLNIKI